LKSFLIYIAFSATVLTKGLASLRIINAKLRYARSLAGEFVSGLELKASSIK